MGHLEESLRHDLRCTVGEASRLAARARSHAVGLVAEEEDTDEDLLVRLQDPRLYGTFAEPALRDPTLRVRTRTAVATRLFDRMPLPRTEWDVVLVEARAPRNLLAFVSFLARHDALTDYHLLHVLYALFLDRALVVSVPQDVRGRALTGVLEHAVYARSQCFLYAGLHLASVPEEEASAELLRVVRARRVPTAFRKALLRTIAEGRFEGEWLEVARREGLLPSDAPLDSLAALAVLPRLPPSVKALARQEVTARTGSAPAPSSRRGRRRR